MNTLLDDGTMNTLLEAGTMNTLVLIPGRKSLRYACSLAGEAVTSGTIRGFRWQGPTAALQEVRAILDASGFFDGSPAAIAVRGVFGGEEFPAPAPLDAHALARLQRMAPQSPLHVAGLLEVAEALAEVLPGVPAMLAFETSFFVDLPARERTYAVAHELSGKLGLRRWGYHGLHHEAACLEAARELRRRGGESSPRILSVCLDARPEIAGVVGRRPVCVTSGSTPLEGLPGETNCGEIDPALALALAGQAGLGPEGANAVLTSESGLGGLVGRPVRLDEVLTGRRGELARPRELLLYRMLLAAGSSAAAMGGVDAVVFSGRYLWCAPVVAGELLPSLEAAGALLCPASEWHAFPGTLESILGELAGLHATSGPARPSGQQQLPEAHCGQQQLPEAHYGPQQLSEAHYGPQQLSEAHYSDDEELARAIGR